MNIEHISVSRLGCWDQCQEQYKFKYHLKTPSPFPEPIYFAYGKTLHKIAEEYVERGDPDQWHTIIAEVMSGQIELEPGKFAPELNAEYKKKLGSHLINLRAFINKIGLEGVKSHVEYKFKYDLNPPHEFLATGFIDRIIEKNGKFFIIDYKTTKKGPWRKNATTVLKDLQLRMYCKVVQRDFGVKAEDIRAYLFYMDSGKGDLVGAKYSQAAIDEAETEMREAYRQIVTFPAEAARGNVGEHCRRCDFRDLCKFRNSPSIANGGGASAGEMPLW